MLDQIIIDGIGSYADFEASVASRDIGEPKKKVIRQTIPFSNVTYDFSKIDGELYWEDRELKYVLEITADTPEELERKKTAFKSWVMNVMNGELHDPFIADYHFFATFGSIDFDDSEVEKTTANVTFTAYPYKIANEAKQFSFALTTGQQSGSIVNNSSHRIVPTLTSDVAFTIELNGVSYSVPAGTGAYEEVMLEQGENAVLLTGTSAGTLTVAFNEEVF